MSAKTQFFKKLESSKMAFGSGMSKGDADIAAFCQKMEQLHENIKQWLEGSGLVIKTRPIKVVELLLRNGSFPVTEITVSLEGRTLSFTPLFLYGQGVTGCTEVTLSIERKQTTLTRLLMRSGRNSEWLCCPVNTAYRCETYFDEEMFFCLLSKLLP
ncbi:hypothetical protein [Pantoea sp. GD03673]|uniref:hypothetical protein n=1 Tax=Pantoea sp. GD03673 TaxID=2975364 RepID=UPI00244A62AB|nr:hypothetical protein [Pantoea sp. GD03673]MDH2066232.1 hypothetical protein [Pantoea sp. GD03673]